MLDLDAYLTRIGLANTDLEPLDLLRAVIAGHVAAIPFENLDIVLGRRIALDLGSLEAKLVRRRRGGYCFEHNTLLKAALEALGFRVLCRMARVVRGAPAGAVTPRTHMFLQVALPDGDYLADAGFGNLTPTAPLRCGTDTAQLTGHEPFRMVGNKTLEVRLAGGWEPAYRFDGGETFPIDHEVANWFTSTFPGGKFTANGIAARPAPGCRKTLLNGVVTVRDLTGTPERFVTATGKALQEALAEHFGIRLSLDEAEDALTAMCGFAERPGPRFE